MTTNIKYRPPFSKACLVVLATAMLLMLAGLSAGEDQTFCGTKQCSVGQDAQGNYFVRFSCQGQYPVSGTCTGIPASIIVFEQNPARVSCASSPPCPTGRCGSGSTIRSHISCSGNESASYVVDCAANSTLMLVGVESTSLIVVSHAIQMPVVASAVAGRAANSFRRDANAVTIFCRVLVG